MKFEKVYKFKSNIIQANILQWIKNNADKFANYDFTGIPDSAFISSADLLQGPARSSKVPLTFKTVEDVKRWLKDPEKHPIKGIPMPAMSNEYYNIYETAYNIMKKYDFKIVEMKYELDVVKNHFPKNHLLFGDIDLVYYDLTTGLTASNIVYNLIDNQTTFLPR